MKFGLSTLTRGIFSNRDNYMGVAKAAERAGFDFLSVSDHLIVPGNLKTRYPYTATGAFRGHRARPLLRPALHHRLPRRLAPRSCGC